MTSAPRLTLCPIGPDDYDRVAHLRVAPDQLKYSGSVAEAFAAGEPEVDFHAICLETRPVGFFKIDRAYAVAHPFARAGEPGLRAFLIDLDHQGQGLATRGLRALPAYLPRHYPDAESLVLTVNMSNTAASRCYLKAGFVDTGEIHTGGLAGPQHVMRLTLRERLPRRRNG